MAGFQQAANAITGAYGTVAGRVGIYSELVGKNKKLIGELKTANKSLEESNEKITGLNDELSEKNKRLQAAQEMSAAQAQQVGNLANRVYANARSRASRDIMLDVVYGEKETAGPTRDYAKEQLKQEREEGGK